MAASFQHDMLGQRVLFGTGYAAAYLAEEVQRLGARSVMLIASNTQRALAARVSAGIEVALSYEDVVQHVPAENAAQARAAAAEHGIDLLVSVGGGSTTGLAKAIALTSRVPIIAVPTTYAGSEATNVWGVTERGRKTTGSDDRVLPTTVIYDAELTVTVPVDLSITSGLNALGHSVDALWGPRVDPINAALATDGIRALATSLPALAANPADRTAREQALQGAYLAAAAFTSAGSGLHHKLCHVLGGTHDLPHADMHAIVLPHVLAFNATSAPEASRRVADALGSTDAVTGLVELRDRLAAPTALHKLGLTKDSLDKLAELTLPAVPESNPRPITHGELYALLHAAWAGDTPQITNSASKQQTREQALLEQVVTSFDDTPDSRLRTLMQALTRHLHAFIREVRLTEAEWDAAIQFLTAVGHITDDKRQEFILLSDVLGASMQTITVNNETYGAATEATVFGPFFVEGSPHIDLGGDLAGTAPGEPCWVEGTVTDTDGNPVPEAHLDVWEADEHGFYDVQYSEPHLAGRGHLFSDQHGHFRFWCLTPTPYSIPHDGPVGRMLEATGRSPMRAAHLHFKVTASGLRTLVTHIFVRGDELLNYDTVFGVRPSLITDFTRQQPDTPTPDGRDLTGHPWSWATFNIVLAPLEAQQTPARNDVISSLERR